LNWGDSLGIAGEIRHCWLATRCDDHIICVAGDDVKHNVRLDHDVVSARHKQIRSPDRSKGHFNITAAQEVYQGNRFNRVET
jgi:hypothetical protein